MWELFTCHLQHFLQRKIEVKSRLRIPDSFPFKDPGSSRYVKFLPFGRFFGTNFTLLGRSLYKSLSGGSWKGCSQICSTSALQCSRGGSGKLNPQSIFLSRHQRHAKTKSTLVGDNFEILKRHFLVNEGTNQHQWRSRLAEVDFYRQRADDFATQLETWRSRGVGGWLHLDSLQWKDSSCWY